jgi:hypothetical protein
MLDRRFLFTFLPLSVACAVRSKSLSEMLPQTVEGGWTLAGTKPLGGEDTPAVAQTLGVKEAIAGTYRGSGTIRVRLFGMNVEASAFELIQKWRQQDGQALYKGRYFFVADPDGPDEATTAAFLRAFMNALNPS